MIRVDGGYFRVRGVALVVIAVLVGCGEAAASFGAPRSLLVRAGFFLMLSSVAGLVLVSQVGTSLGWSLGFIILVAVGCIAGPLAPFVYAAIGVRAYLSGSDRREEVRQVRRKRAHSAERR